MRTNKEYVLACAKAQGKISMRMLHFSPEENKTLVALKEEIELLKQIYLKEESGMAEKISTLKHTGKKFVGLGYTDPFGWGGALNTPRGGWPCVTGGGMVTFNEDGTDVKELPFGRVPKKQVPNRGENIIIE